MRSLVWLGLLLVGALSFAAIQACDDPLCPRSQVDCGGVCIDVTTNAASCGACGVTCGTGQVCVKSACAEPAHCSPDQVVCANACVDPLVSRVHCGAGKTCNEDEATLGTACARGEVCAEGACAFECPSGLVNCEGTCVNPKTSRTHCGVTEDCGGDGGTVGTECGAGTVCADGVCAIACPPGLVECNGVCVDPSSHRSYCGATEGCGQTGGSVGVACGAGEVCAAGVCSATCQNGFVNCGGTCIDPDTSRTHCGASMDCSAGAGTDGAACAVGEVCSMGACGLSCQGGFVNCGGICFDPAVSRTHCGATEGCGTAAGGLAGEVCDPGELCSAGGRCELFCPPGFVKCGTACIDPTSNRSNCGATDGCGVTGGTAGLVCASGYVCAMGGCALSCPPGFVQCGADCVDPTSSPTHCGASGGCGGMAGGTAGVACGGSAACVTGVCKQLASGLPPVTAGLTAYYSARNAGSITKDGTGLVSQWRDLSGNGRTLVPNGAGPIHTAGLINGVEAMNFGGGRGMISAAPFALNTEITLFVVTQYKVPGGWGSFAHHGSRDGDWALEQNAFSPLGLSATHFQSVNDNSGVELQLTNGTNYVLVGRITGSTRYYSATSGATVTTTGVGVSIGPGVKTLYVGKSEAGEAVNAYIGELVYYNRSLSDPERDSVLAWLRGKWGGI